MSRFKNFGISVLALTLATFFVAKTETGQALATQVAGVFVTNDAAHAVPVSGSVAVSGSVSVANFPAAPSVRQFRRHVHLTVAGGSEDFFPNDDPATLIVDNVSAFTLSDSGNV